MTKGLRLSEKWFRWGLWCIAILFASFLIGLGSLVVADLPKAEKPIDADQYADRAQLRSVRDRQEADRAALADNDEAQQRARNDLQHTTTAFQSERERFDSWIAT